jgi:hypothetical protein
MTMLDTPLSTLTLLSSSSHSAQTAHRLDVVDFPLLCIDASNAYP